MVGILKYSEKVHNQIKEIAWAYKKKNIKLKPTIEDGKVKLLYNTLLWFFLLKISVSDLLLRFL